MIEIKNLSKTFSQDGNEVHALNDINLTIEDGDIFGIIGMSGAGKSTLIRCINMLEKPSEGSVIIDGQNICKLSGKELRNIRHSITMIFQHFNLLQQKTCLKNVCFPLELMGESKADAKKKALELLSLVGLSDKANQYPSRLSGGQQQRVAIARALATNPKFLLCDEATSALDPTTTNSILSLLRDINEKLGITIIIITHQMSVVEAICKHVAILEKGSVCETGTVNEVFSRPKSAAAKKLVFPEGNPESLICATENSRFIRVVFNGSNATEKPLIAKMATETGIEANISYASTRSIGGKAYGSMLLGVENVNNNVERAIDYLIHASDVFAEEVQINV